MRTRIVFIGAACLLAVACYEELEQPSAPDLAQPLISDGAHSGNPHFFWLPPIVPEPTYSGTFDGSLSPVVKICEWTGTDCVLPLVATFTTEDGPNSETVRVGPEEDEPYEDPHYIVNWHTDESDLSDTETYRVMVLVAGTTLGYADVRVYASDQAAENANTGNEIALKDGRTLPIKFRIEHGAVYVVGTEAATISAMSGAVKLEIPAGALMKEVGITVQPDAVVPPDPNVVPGSVFNFGPDETVFALPILLTISYDPSSIPIHGDENSLVLGHVVDGVWTDVVGSTANTLNHTVTGPIQGFSRLGARIPVTSVLSASLAFESDRDGDGEIFVRKGTGERQITNNTVTDGGADWLGCQIAFHREESGFYDIWTVAEPDGVPVNLTQTPERHEMAPKWSPDGSKIAFSRLDEAGTFQIWVRPVPWWLSDPQNLTGEAGGGGAAWSPDGSQIAFHSARDGNLEVYVMSSDGGPATRLTFDEDKSDGSPAWSPDGTQIAYSKYVPGYEGDIWVLTVDGSEPPRKVTSDDTAIDYAPDWSPDGTQIAFERFTGLPARGDIWVINPDGSGLTPIARDPAADERAPAWRRPCATDVAWTYVADMGTARSGSAAVRVPHDGRIYVIGGSDDTGQPTNTVEAYDEETDTWTAVASMQTARSHHAAIFAYDYILVVGGLGEHGLLNEVEAYNIWTESWSFRAEMPTARSHLAVTYWGYPLTPWHTGDIAAIGGIGEGGTLSTVESYELLDDRWLPEGDLPTARYDLAAAATPGGVLAIGGWDGGALNTVEVYNGGWFAGPSMPTARQGLAVAVVHPGLVYAMGGNTEWGFGWTKTVEVYNPETQIWGRVHDMQVERFRLAAVTGSDGWIYAIGGYPGEPPILRSVETYPGWNAACAPGEW